LTRCRAGWLENGIRNNGTASAYLQYPASINNYTTRLTGIVIYTPEALGGDYRIINENNAGGTYPFLLRTSSSSKMEFYSVYGPAGLLGATTLQVGRTYMMGFTMGAAGTLLYLDGILDATGTYGGTSMSNSVDLTVGSDLGTGGMCGIVDEVRLYNRELSASEMRQLYQAARTGYQRELNWLDRLNVAPYVPLNNYAITASQGSFALTGQSANLLYNRKVTAAQGSFALTGQDAGLRTTRTLVCDYGAFTLTGQAAALTRGYTMTADQGSYSLNGQTANLLSTRTLAAAQGSFSLTGQSSNLLRGYRVTASQGSFTLTGQAANLLRGLRITADVGSFTVNGQAVNLNRGYAMVAGSGSYALTGQDAGLTRTYVTQADYGSFSATGQDAGLLATRTIQADAGSYSLTGQDSGLFANRVVAAVTGEFTLTGQSVSLVVAVPLRVRCATVTAAAKYSTTVSAYSRNATVTAAATYTATGVVDQC
jgi:hypothetical protein